MPSSHYHFRASLPSLRLTALQLPARFGAIEEQLAYAQLLLEGGPRTDLVLLPEAAITGYVSPKGDFDLTRFAEPLDGPTRAAYAHLAKRFDALIVGPLVEKMSEVAPLTPAPLPAVAGSGRIFNSLIGVAPDGSTLIHYRKHHPWFPETWATAGPMQSAVVRWRGKKITTRICFDVHFLEADATRELDEADVLLFASAWVDEEDDARPGLLQPLAKSHSVSVLNANWGPGSPRIKGQGGSLFVDSRGELLSRLKTDTGRLDVMVP